MSAPDHAEVGCALQEDLDLVRSVRRRTTRECWLALSITAVAGTCVGWELIEPREDAFLCLCSVIGVGSVVTMLVRRRRAWRRSTVQNALRHVAQHRASQPIASPRPLNGQDPFAGTSLNRNRRR